MFVTHERTRLFFGEASPAKWQLFGQTGVGGFQASWGKWPYLFTASADTIMFAVSSTDVLVRIDLATGAGQSIGSIGFNGNSWGLAFNHVLVPAPGGGFFAVGTLFGVETTTDQLYTFDLATGAATLIGTGLGATSGAESLTFDLAGNLMTVDNGRIYTINTATGVASPGPLTTAVVDGLDMTPVPLMVQGVGLVPAGTIFGVDNGPIFILDPVTGAVTNIGNVTNTVADETLAFAPDGTLYGLGIPANNYDLNHISLDPVGGTLIGSTGFSNLWGSAIIPEPATLSLLSLCLTLRRRHRDG